jgi:hypothetical protein
MTLSGEGMSAEEYEILKWNDEGKTPQEWQNEEATDD